MKVILYARFSPRANEDECDSCDKQLADMREFCARKGWGEVDFKHDDALSGARTHNILPGTPALRGRSITSLADSRVMRIASPRSGT